MMKTIIAMMVALLAAQAQAKSCEGLPSYAEVKKALKAARGAANGGLNLDMWGTVVDRTGIVCTVAYTGDDEAAQWPGSRLISAQKANTANAFSLKGLALSTANLYSPTQPGGTLFGLQASNPINVNVAYKGEAKKFGTPKDPLVGERIGGVNVFGGGLALYNGKGVLVGAIGVSGDTSCADHNIAWRARHDLGLDHVAKGVSAANNDQIIYDIENGKSKGGFGHPVCSDKEKAVAAALPPTAAKAAKN